ncbi:hypothetical protein WKR88_11485 [Trinickia caryophylli]|uniref:hypothetical protein n=1 Tax=Trinickia caryophylli TaxID=28094 RepID=UPI0013B38374|nr:hypothetical protein [Trinickia caryophylli]WQE15775.1 hypothetical protein U0034_22575 [Trinickia caryophylli]GLU30919.1 hypothetical protein Busp01_07610 [Trinickia caryophylli]
MAVLSTAADVVDDIPQAKRGLEIDEKREGRVGMNLIGGNASEAMRSILRNAAREVNRESGRAPRAMGYHEGTPVPFMQAYANPSPRSFAAAGPRRQKGAAHRLVCPQ